MDSEIIYQHLKWVKSIEQKYKYVEQESDSGEFAAFFQLPVGSVAPQLGR